MIAEVQPTTEIPELQEYLARSLPEHLRPGSPPPQSWTGSAESWWQAAVAQARDFERARLTAEFAAAISRGWESWELATGEKNPGTTGSFAGSPRRPEPADFDEPTRREARLLLEAVDALLPRWKVDDPRTHQDLMKISVGAFIGEGRPAESIFQVARSAVAQKESEIARAKQERSEISQMIGDDDFGGPGGRRFHVGRTYEVTMDEREALEESWRRQEREAAQRGQPPARTGHAWPPGRFLA